MVVFAFRGDRIAENVGTRGYIWADLTAKGKMSY